MTLIKNFTELSKNDAAIAGGKGASLGEMTQAGISVPPGFVVLADTFEKFLEETDLNVEIDSILESVNHKEIHTVDSASERIQGLILHVEMPSMIATDILSNFKGLNTEFVAVRSSATAEDGAEHAWAGQLDSYLNTKEAGLLDKVKHCWASLFTPRAIFYRFEKGLHDTKISVAVVVQKMVNSEKSGIAFSVHPVTQDFNQLIIEAGFGLGEAIVSGQVTPNSYVVEKEPRRIIDKNVSNQGRGLYRMSSGGSKWQDLTSEIGDQPVLSDEQILMLSELILTIENHYGFPCDIEWAFEAGEFYIVQSRPITTLAPLQAATKTVEDAINPFLLKKWTKIWTTEYSLFSVWLFGREYIVNCKEEFGFGFDDIIFLIEGDLATVYRDNKKQKEFVKFLAEKTLNDGDFRAKCLEKYLEMNNKFIKYLELSEEEALSYENLFQFIEDHKKFIVYFLLILWAPNGFDTIEAPEDIKTRALQECERARKLTESTYPNLEKFIKKLYLFIAQKENVEAKFLAAILPDELLKYSQSRVLPALDLLKQRYDYSVLLANQKENKLVFGEEARVIIERISSISEINLNELNGAIANKGKVAGSVRKVFMGKDMENFRQGEILVTTMTRPEWLPIMKIAAAFVTDAGGILSHAAIVARELNKPCIIDTKIATQVLKDGDMVEVDADNGIVRIIK